MTAEETIITIRGLLRDGKAQEALSLAEAWNAPQCTPADYRCYRCGYRWDSVETPKICQRCHRDNWSLEPATSAEWAKSLKEEAAWVRSEKLASGG